jgi:hypothetical protein
MDLDSAIDDACHTIDLLAKAAMIGTGYRQHHRGEW